MHLHGKRSFKVIILSGVTAVSNYPYYIENLAKRQQYFRKSPKEKRRNVQQQSKTAPLR
jgi:hypothetical protein